MPTLAELQRRFAEALLEDDPAPVAGLIVSDTFPGERRLQVYRNNVFGSLTRALGDVYPVIERLVGEGFFGYAGREYIRRHPSRSGNLHDFGARLAEFLRGFEPARELVYLPDVARLEWARHEVFHAAEHPPLSMERLVELMARGRERLHFRLNPAGRLIASQYPVLRIWEVNQPDYRGDQMVELDAGGDRLLVIRRGLQVQIRPLDAGEYALLDALRADLDFGEACEAGLAADEALDLTACFQRHLAHGTLVDAREAGVTPA